MLRDLLLELLLSWLLLRETDPWLLQLLERPRRLLLGLRWLDLLLLLLLRLRRVATTSSRSGAVRGGMHSMTDDENPMDLMP